MKLTKLKALMFPTLDLEGDWKGEPLIQMTTFPSYSPRGENKKNENIKV